TGGLEFVHQSPLLKVALVLEVVSGLFGHNVTLITVIARDVIGTGPQGLGLLLSALGSGALLGMAFMVAFEVKRHVHVIWTAGTLYTLWLAGFALSSWLPLSIALLFDPATT